VCRAPGPNATGLEVGEREGRGERAEGCWTAGWCVDTEAGGPRAAGGRAASVGARVVSRLLPVDDLPVSVARQCRCSPLSISVTS